MKASRTGARTSRLLPRRVGMGATAIKATPIPVFITFIVCVMLATAGLVTLGALTGPTLADAAVTTPLSTVDKFATDQTNGSKANSTGLVGNAAPGDTLNWVVNYSNNQTTPSDVNIKDVIQPGQSYVPGSLQVPTGTTPQYSTNAGSTWTAGTPTAASNGVGATATAFAPSSSATSPAFSAGALGLVSQGGDGWSVEGYQDRVYTMFHHTVPEVYCQVVGASSSSNCPGFANWPVVALSFDYSTAYDNGSFILNGKLYGPAQSNVSALNPIGFWCFNVVTNSDCGFVQTGNTVASSAVVGAANGATDGIAASDGNYYMIDTDGDLMCFNGAPCGTYPGMFGANPVDPTQHVKLATYGRYVYVSGINPLVSPLEVFSCFDTVTKTRCSGFPVTFAAPPKTTYSGDIFPVLNGGALPGGLLGACAGGLNNVLSCYSPSGAQITTPAYPASIGGFSSPNGSLGQGVVYNSRYYGWNALPTGGQIVCYTFSASGAVTACPGFTGLINTSRNGYTVRALENYPGCLASDGDDGRIDIFSATTGAPCNLASQKVTMAPLSYCDGAPHATTWGTATIPGLSGSAYSQGTYTVLDANGNPVAGYNNVAFTGALNVNLSPIPTTGVTATITVQVNLTNVTGTVNASSIKVTRTGDTYSQVCYKTTVAPAVCGAPNSTIVNNAFAVTTNGSSTDSPTGNKTGNVVFNVVQPTGGCTLAIKKVASAGTAPPGSAVTYTITVQNTGTTAYTTARPASITDDLTNVLAGATYNNDATATTGTVSYSSPTLAWSGALAPGQTATITYTITLSSTANSGTLKNTVISPNPSNCKQGYTTPDCTATVTVKPVLQKLFIEKIGESGQNTWVPMDGSSWAVFNDDAGQQGTPYTGTGVTPAVPQATGLFQLQDIPAGTYWLTETSAPDGFNLLAEPVQFTISATGVVSIVQGSGGGVVTAADADADNIYTITVRDVPALKMPESGGIGWWPFTAGGVMLLLVAAALTASSAGRPKNQPAT